ncbi:MAG: hypothetical protein UV64_C0027G0004 [Parcubacteria group bacterium GW2011_GWC1_43_11b]|uniref:Uncharacterized protein n=1 Tax=Candidatus Vogelbacteria bacterium RIFOXYB1_FULL_42_16 TaxID=1802436 RepID=A0A1G2QBQ3_9BACT|nr:MAG: hypothetical protein UV50_C0006G0058 [Parcubacteria group bacterium GW2011_GWB1_42_9]KKS88193.1 MAG: hypothetical protein UV64_C0027G0004 [Parcubacteria group bacterium GW2011_GWC1_43_11b]KKT08935.1 MAG: hypothetical protein UV88_C0017G0005 [Parcubacteria group bacterium GW2011_GWA1_43_21]OHA57990.1 MAG: hypothetical protein A2370_01200 [Candidatus Vogelbacteria bacterium RIFOXYB1_FULL_42_16]
MKKNRKSNGRNLDVDFGYTLIEVLVAITVFLIISVAVYDGYVSLLRLVTNTKIKTMAIALANEQLEIARNLPYDSVGLVDGMPVGILPRFATSTRGGIDFSVRLSIQDIDDPFDGQIGSSTKNDLAPNDYKRVAVEISCVGCRDFQPFTATSLVAPTNLENNTGNGALFVQVIDANGQPVTEADVRITLASTTRSLDIQEKTDNQGMFKLVNTYPAILEYKIVVSKSGYSSERTYAPGENGLANPVLLHATVIAGTVTQTTLAIDRLANISLKTMDKYCGAIGNVPIVWQGSKLLATNPNVLKIDDDFNTDSSGLKNLLGVEWDTYSFSPQLSGYVLAGSLPLQSLAVAPGSDNDIKMILTPLSGQGLLVSVKDGVSNLPLADANVRLSGNGFDDTLVTNRGFWKQSDWSGGSGQDLWSNVSQYSASSGLADTNPAGEIKLAETLGVYNQTGWLESSIFNTGSASTTYYQIGWLPLNQPAGTGYGDILVQLAVSNDPATTTWDYFGPDGTSDSFYTATTTTVHANANNQQYIRYRLFFHTDDLSVTPSLSDFYITYGSECLPFGQVYFDGLATGNYTLDISKAGYQLLTNTITIDQSWQAKEIKLLNE